MMAIGRSPAGKSSLAPSAGKLAAHLASVLLSMPVAAAKPGTVTGRLTYDGTPYTLRHVYAWQPPLQGEELWIYLSHQALPPAAAQQASLPEELAREKRFGGVKLIVHPVKPRLDDKKGVVYAPREDGFSLDKFNFGPSWQALAINQRRVTGKQIEKVEVKGDYAPPCAARRAGSGQFPDPFRPTSSVESTTPR